MKPEGFRARARGGFSLIEMLAAMSVLAVIMLLLGRIFGDSSRAIRSGASGADVNASARAVMDFVARDISMAMLDHPDSAPPPYLHLRIYNNERIAGSPANLGNLLGLRTNDFRALMFVAPLNTQLRAAEPRSTRVVQYRLRTYQQRVGGANVYTPHRYELMRGELPATSLAAAVWYNNPDWSDHSTDPASVYDRVRTEGRLVIQNVRDFSLAYHTNHTGTAAALTDPAETRSDVSPLAFLDIRLELLPEEDAVRAAEIWSLGGAPSRTALEFVERAARRYFRRVYFYNQRTFVQSHGE